MYLEYYQKALEVLQAYLHREGGEGACFYKIFCSGDGSKIIFRDTQASPPSHDWIYNIKTENLELWELGEGGWPEKKEIIVKGCP